MILKNIDDFTAMTGYVVAYGGDGTVLDVIRKNPNKTIIPVRNYGLCEYHKNRYNLMFDGLESDAYNMLRSLNTDKCYYLQWKCFHNNVDFNDKGISEIVVKNSDPTSAIRFNLVVDHKCIVKNAIADGLIASTTYGSTGYFKSISRCSFNCDGIGLAFIAPMQNLSNCILPINSNIDIELVRDAEIIVTSDKTKVNMNLKAGEHITLFRTNDFVTLIGLDAFHCSNCRMLRHAADENGDIIEDLYIK